MFCPKCGKKCSDDSQFCVNCGARLDRRAPTAAPATPTDPTVKQNPAAAPQPTPEPARTRSSRAPVVVCVIAALVIVGAGAFAAWHFLLSPSAAGDGAPATVEQVDEPVAIDEQTFPDEGVRAAVTLLADTDQDGTLTPEEGSAVIELTVDGATTVSGLGPYLPNVESLTLRGDSLSEVSTSDLPHLGSISVEGGSLDDLDLSHNHELTQVTAPDAAVGEVKLPATGAVESVQVPEGTVVSGLEEAGLREEWAPVSIQDGWRTFTIERDPAGRITTMTNESDGMSESTVYTYDAAGNLSQSANTYRVQGVDPSFSDTVYTCDDAGRILTAQETNGALVTYQYDDAGRVVHVTEDWGDGLVYEMTAAYDSQGRVTEVYDGRGNGLPYIYTYRYDGAGRLVEATVASDNSGTPMNALTRTYTYDENGHLASIAASGEGARNYAPLASFTFDEETGTLLGSCELESESFRATSYVAAHYNERGQLTGISESNQPISAVEGDPQVTYQRYIVRSDAPTLAMGYQRVLTGDTLIGAQICSLIGYLEEGPEVVDPRLAVDRYTNYFF